MPSPRHLKPGRHYRLKAPPAAVASTLVLCLIAWLGWGTTTSKFGDTAGTAGNAMTTGTVSFGPNTPVGALFTVSNSKPGSLSTTCIKVTYTGALTAGVRLYVAAGDLTGTGLGSYLTLQVNEGTGDATGGSCADFASTANLYNATGLSDTTKTIAAFASASSGYASGVSAWSAASNATRTFQFRWRQQALNAAVGKTMSVTFSWEAQA